MTLLLLCLIFFVNAVLVLVLVLLMTLLLLGYNSITFYEDEPNFCSKNFVSIDVLLTPSIGKVEA